MQRVSTAVLAATETLAGRKASLQSESRCSPVRPVVMARGDQRQVRRPSLLKTVEEVARVVRIDTVLDDDQVHVTRHLVQVAAASSKAEGSDVPRHRPALKRGSGDQPRVDLRAGIGGCLEHSIAGGPKPLACPAAATLSGVAP